MTKKLTNELDFPVKELLQKTIDSGHENDAFIILEFWMYIASRHLPKPFKYSCEIDMCEEVDEAVEEYLAFSDSEEVKDLFCLCWKELMDNERCKGLLDEMKSLYSEKEIHRKTYDLADAPYKGTVVEKWVAPVGSKIKRVQDFIERIDGLFDEFGIKRKMGIWESRY